MWEKCGKEYYEISVENNNMGKLWKICEKNSVEKNSVGKYGKQYHMGKVWKSCEKNVKKIGWEKCAK